MRGTTKWQVKLEGVPADAFDVPAVDDAPGLTVWAVALV